MKASISGFEPLLPGIDIEGPIIIAGPCSAESREQVLETAKAIAQHTDVKIFRAGIWKPRTRPSRFEGVGTHGLQWLVEAREQTGLKLAVEVASSEHVEQCLRHNIDILWIGARTTVNPFSVQEVAQALRGTNSTVLVKNPLHPDLSLWMGTIERVVQAGIKKIAAVHRGFFIKNKSPFRNEPLWEIPIELMRQYPGLPVICDPSHIGGSKPLIRSISQKALDLEMQGLMIETHFRPEEALTDAKQQLDPGELSALLRRLVLRNSQNTFDSQFELERLRIRIDEIDQQLMSGLSDRMDMIVKLGMFKKENNLSVLQLQRWNQMLADRLQMADSLCLNHEFLLKFFQLLHQEAIQIQTDIMNTNPELDKL